MMRRCDETADENKPVNFVFSSATTAELYLATRGSRQNLCGVCKLIFRF